MKLTKISALLLLLVSYSTASAAISITVSAVTGAGNGVLTNLQSSTGNNTAARVWGILVDSNDDGVSLDSYLFGSSLSLNSTNILQRDVSGVATNTDDVLYIASSLMINTNNTTLDGGTLNGTGLARPTSFLNIPTPNGSLGDNFYIVWFDEVSATGTTVVGGKYGAFRLPTFEAPADGASLSLASNFVGADTARVANFSWDAIAPVPETSTSLFGALGALALLRRRRN
jgi:hypothetical protein